MATNNGTLKVYNNTYIYSFSDNEIKASNIINENIIIIKNKAEGKKRVYINNIIKG